MQYKHIINIPHYTAEYDLSKPIFCYNTDHWPFAAVVMALYHGYNHAAEGGDFMKVIERNPLRHRGRSEEQRQATKEAIRDVYANGLQKAVQIIPAKNDLIPEGEKKKLQVCAYCRVSTDEDNQASSYELQVQNYTKMIRENPEWEFAGIFADESISGTSVLHREQFLAMIEKCKAGETSI